MNDIKIRSRSEHGSTLVELSYKGSSPVSGLEILNFHIWFSGIKVPVSGIASVYTKKQYRNRGYARQCLEYALKLQKESGATISLLFGAPELYERFGYAEIMRWYGINVALDILNDLPPHPAMPVADQKHQTSLLKIYNAQVKNSIGPVVRTSKEPINPHQPVRWRTKGQTHVLVASTGKLQGYVCHSDAEAGEFEVVEVFANDNDCYRRILSYLSYETQRRGKKEFIVALPIDDPFALFLRQYDARFVIAASSGGRGMAQVINLDKLCRLIAPVFKHRVRLLKRSIVPKKLLFLTQAGQGVIPIGGCGPSAKVEGPIQVIAQLLFGYITPSLAIQSRIKSYGLGEIAEVIFPQKNAFVYLKDRF